MWLEILGRSSISWILVFVFNRQWKEAPHFDLTFDPCDNILLWQDILHVSWDSLIPLACLIDKENAKEILRRVLS